MIVKSDKETWRQIVIMFSCFTFGILLYSEGTIPIGFLCLFAFCYYVLICWTITVGKTIVMDEKGCTLSLWKYQKTYAWDEFKLKRIEDYRDIYHSPTNQVPYSAYAIFSTKEIYRFKSMRPDTYNHWFHPFSFSFFYVYYKVENMDCNGYLHPNIYPVDEKEFMEKMQEWGIELEVYNAREERFK